MGVFEMFIIVPVALVGLGIPLIGLILIFLIYQKLNRIERLLGDKNMGP